jgi:hypothetical protein
VKSFGKSPCGSAFFAKAFGASRFARCWDDPGGEFRPREAGSFTQYLLARTSLLGIAQLSLPNESPEENLHGGGEWHCQQGAHEASENQRPKEHRENHGERV